MNECRNHLDFFHEVHHLSLLLLDQDYLKCSMSKVHTLINVTPWDNTKKGWPGLPLKVTQSPWVNCLLSRLLNVWITQLNILSHNLNSPEIYSHNILNSHSILEDTVYFTYISIPIFYKEISSQNWNLYSVQDQHSWKAFRWAPFHLPEKERLSFPFRTPNSSLNHISFFTVASASEWACLE